MKNHYVAYPKWGRVCLILSIIALHSSLFAQKNKPSADLEQFRNGSFSNPVDPGTWTTGNNGSSNSHYAEAMSAPYRVVMKNLAPNSEVALTLEYDVQHSGKMALDYLTSYDRIEPHIATFGHSKEEINPTIGTSLFQSPPESPSDVEPIPLPLLANSPVAGQPQNSFNNVAGTGQAQMAIWNGTINNINYVGGMPDLSDPANQSQRVQVSFTTGTDPSKTVILAWGGHLASRNDWGFDGNGQPMSAGGISGSPHHMRLISWNFGNLGSQDLSLSIELVSAPDIPALPTNFSATAVSTDQIDLSWDQVVSSVTVNYMLERALSGGGPWTQIASLPQGTTNFSDTELSEFTRYFYRLSASNSDGTSSYANATTRTLSPISSATNSNGKSRDKIGWELDALFRGVAGESPAEFIYQFNENGDVLIEIIAFKNPSTVEAVINLLKADYGRVDSDFLFDPQFYIDRNRNLIDVYMSVPLLDNLNYEEIINFARPVFRTFNSSIGVTGVLSQGDSTQTSRDVRASFKVPDSIGTKFVDGRGIKVAVLSNSFNTEPFSGADSRYVTDQKNGDLPGPFNLNYQNPVEVLSESLASDTDEGRAMLHIVHDIAPGADLGFYSGTRSLNTFARGIEAASQSGYTITVDDITFMFESVFKHEGFVFDVINDHVNRSEGNMHFSSAGNFADKGKAGILDFDALPDYSDIYESGTTAYIHDFGGGDHTLDIFANIGQYVLSLQWNEAFSSLGDPTGAVSDVDLYIVDDSLQLIAGSNRINILGDAAELLVLNSSAARPAKLIITFEGATPPAGLEFRLVAFKTSGNGDGLVFTNPISGPTVTGHAAFDIENSVTAGASFYGFYTDSSDIEPFSSLGLLGEVDITGPDGANTNVNTIGSDILYDSDVFNNFFGTSAAVPHVAAAYALMLEAAPLWYPAGVPAEKFDDPNYATSNPADQARGLFSQTAYNIGNTAKTGSGLIQVEDAFREIATQTSVLLGFTYDSTKVISVDSVLVTLRGDYFNPVSQVLLNGDSVETTYISETELQVLVPPFSGAAGIAVDSKGSSTPSGADGGESNPIDLLEGRRAITIIADDAVRTFGQDFDNLTFSISGLIGGETYDSLGLPDIVLNSTAVGPFPDIGNYIITPVFAEPLSAEQNSNFIVAINPGVLSFTPLELTIQPIDTAITYGEMPPFIMNYLYDTTGISNNSELLEFLRAEHESTYLVDTSGTGLVNRFSAVVNRFSAVVNENPDLVDDLIDLLSNSNWMATETTIENRFSAVVNAIEFDADQLIDYLIDPLVGNSTSIENRFSAVVNGDDLVNGSTVIWDPVENRFSAVVNRFSAVVNRFSAVVNVPLGTESDSTDLSQTLAIVDAEDGSSDGEPVDTLKVYSINVVTGFSVTNSMEERHYMLSGAALAPVFTNFILNFQPGLLTVNPAPMVVDLDDEDVPIELNFGDPTPVFTSTTGTPVYHDEISIDYNFNPEPASANPVNAGTYAIEQSANITNGEGMDVTSNYVITYINGSLVVNPGILVLETEDVIANAGTDLPTLSFTTTISGLVQDIKDVFPGGPTFSYASLAYEASGSGPGVYPVATTVSPDPVNYMVVDNGALLLVNPTDGKKIRVYLDCIAQNKGQATYGFTAYFHYENDNSQSIFIGPDYNFLEGDAFDASGLPFEFHPGSHQVGVEFEGSLRWKVYSFGSINPSSVEVNSDNFNNNNRCSAKDVVINGRTANPDPDGDNLTFFSAEEVQFYPNPVDDYLVVRVNQGFTKQDYQLYDSRGMLHQVNAAIDPVQSTAEFDLSNFETGLYLLKLNIAGTTAIIRILRQ